MIGFTKERIEQFIKNPLEHGLTRSEQMEMARQLLTSMEQEPVAFIDRANLDYLESGADADVWPASGAGSDDVLLYAAPQLPQPAVPDIATVEKTYPDVQTNWQDAKMYAEGWNACRAAMLQGADRPQNEPQNIPENIPATQFKPVADLYGLTSPTGGETSFTFDAVEARDFIDGGWLCQEYVELERFQEAITNHTEDKLAMVDHSGDSNNMVEPVTTANKLPFDQWLSQQTGTIDVECGCVMTEVFFHWLRVAYEAGNYPVIPDGWVLVPEEPTHEMLEAGDEQFGTYDVYRRMIAASPQQK